MKKKYYIIIMICLTSLGLTAQSVITHNGNAPQIGDIYNFSGTLDSFDPGPSGAGQNWDFSDITPTFSSTSTAVAPESTPFAGDFPEATIAFAQSGDNETFIFSQISTSEMLNVGLGNTPSGGNPMVIHYTDAVKLLQYPFSYTDAYTDSYYTAYSLTEGMVTHEWGTISVTADAWGSVLTPEGTFNNTLRIKSERTYTDSVWVSGIFVNAGTYTQTDYQWYTSTSHTPVISISVTGDGSSVTYRTNTLGVGEDFLIHSHINIFPNPATDRISIKADKIMNHISIFSVNGRQMGTSSSQTSSSHQQTIDVSNYPKGVYLIKVGLEDGSIVTERIVKQ